MRSVEVSRVVRHALAAELGEPDLELTGLQRDRPPPTDGEQPWLPVKYGRTGDDEWHGVTVATARWRAGSGAGERPLVVKVSPRDGVGATLLPWIIDRCGITLDRPYTDYAAARETTGTAARELTVLTTSSAAAALAPRLLGGAAADPDGPSAGECAVVAELVTDVAANHLDGATEGWSPARIDAALTALASVHAEHLHAPDEPGPPWAGPYESTEHRLADASLWSGVLDDARRRFRSIVTDDVWRRRRALVDGIADWHPPRDALARTLVHDDANQRNLGFRPDPTAPTGERALAFDWELVRRDVPLRDVVELLTFTLPPTVDRATLDGHVGRWLDALAAAADRCGTGHLVDADALRDALASEVRVEAIDRVGMQLLFAAGFGIDALPYVPRINATVDRLVELTA